MRRCRGFTAIELLCVVSIIGILASVAIPNFVLYQIRAKTTEATVNVEAIAYLERVRIVEVDAAIACEPRPANLSNRKRPFVPTETWRDLGYEAAGQVYFQYEVVLPDDDPTHFVATARGDLDGDGEQSLFTIDSRDMLLKSRRGVY